VGSGETPMLTDLIDEFISRARAHIDARPVRYEFAQCEIDITIRCLIDLRELLESPDVVEIR
jgi:hypothetical protein